MSDFDIGVLFDDGLSPQERFRRRLSLLAEVPRALNVPHVDVAVLNEASPALRFKVIQYGRVLYNQDETVRVRFEAKTLREYLDTRPLRDLYRQRLFEAITAGRFYD
ncbi:MAG: nucleotidyltransferase domain-containing protein [Candidatus Bipolaricaulota bacterium]|nr:nucleotidyltransferase domain-containing protein [Candidatus Bipolaricaulota bacterium]MCS7275363.1 nucleotidyltransferase domain-containing protein [Candidatus Bipolaricaulota bacterium]MDW8110138.1 nucleotidyltransferase domain-containing protein [Candidatus Bipolaricaulota bacterium]MDW8329643.1 nucleotidyltransferase domain-containing protein [Candidatus Bipolaricaulota bacterium]